MLSNAIKFCPENGTVEVDVVSQPTAHNKTLIVCQVIDSGDTISAIDQAALFKKFSQVDNKKEGTGLGLVIVKQLATLMKGSAGFHCLPKGNMFWFSFQADCVDDVVNDQNNTITLNALRSGSPTANNNTVSLPIIGVRKQISANLSKPISYTPPPVHSAVPVDRSDDSKLLNPHYRQGSVDSRLTTVAGLLTPISIQHSRRDSPMTLEQVIRQSTRASYPVDTNQPYKPMSELIIPSADSSSESSSLSNTAPLSFRIRNTAHNKTPKLLSHPSTNTNTSASNTMLLDDNYNADRITIDSAQFNSHSAGTNTT